MSNGLGVLKETGSKEVHVDIVQGIPIQYAPSQVNLDESSFFDLAFHPPPLGSGKEILALIFFILNICVPGMGAICTAILRKSWKVACIGLIQMMSGALGWCFSAYWGMAVWVKTKKENSQAQQQQPYLEVPQNTSGEDVRVPVATTLV